MDYKKLYAEKLVSAEKAASVVKSGDWVDYGWTTGTPVAVDAAIAKRLPELENVNFRERYREKGNRTGIQLLCSDPLFRASEILS